MGSNETSKFVQLITDIKKVLGPSSGITSSDVDPEILQALMKEYTSNKSEWVEYAFPDPDHTYTRNLVDQGNGKSNLLILVWSPGRRSRIHDHSGSHCVMKILKGSLQETLYGWPDDEKIQHGEHDPPIVKKEATYSENEVAYIQDDIGLHRITNASPNECAVSLHLYTPAFGTCHVFDEKTGEATTAAQNIFYSIQGKKT